MLVRACYAVLAVALLALAGIFALRMYRGRRQALPVVQAPAEIAGLSCEAATEKARELTKKAALDRARLSYLWLLSHCQGSAVLPDVMVEAGSLFGYLLHRPQEARRVYEEFLRRFPTHPEAGDVTYNLARLEIDAGDYTAAVALLTTLAQRYPNDWHEESAKFLAAKAGQMLAADRRARHTASGELGKLVPNNLVSLLALLTALGPSVIETVHKARGQSAGAGAPLRWMVPSLIIGLTFLNYVFNSANIAKRDSMLMEKLDHLAAVSARAEGSR